MLSVTRARDGSTRSSHKSQKQPKPVAMPQVWLVVGDKLGDNAQVNVIAEALGWPCVCKRLYFRERYILGKPRFRSSLHHIDKMHSDPLVPPWPDLVITIGRRPAMAALWIRKQSAGRTKIVLLNRPKRYFKQFALIIVSAQFRVPHRTNVLHLDLPLMRVDQAALATAAEHWREPFSGLARPLTALFVGGPTKPFIFDAKVAQQLIENAAAIALRSKGTLYITTSRRTPKDVVEVLQANLPSGSVLYRWDVAGSDNPYRGLLALADQFIVTGDSISMMVEVARLGKPLAIFPLPLRQDYASRLQDRWTKLLHPAIGANKKQSILEPLGHLLYRLGIVRYSRDLAAFHQLFFQRGLAVPLGTPFHPCAQKAPDELSKVVERIKALVDHPKVGP